MVAIENAEVPRALRSNAGAIEKAVVPLADRNIVAIGGALSKLSIGMAAQLMEYIESLSGVEKPRVLIINTASGDDEKSKVWWMEVLLTMNSRWQVTYLTLFDQTPADLRTLILSQDIIYVGGGNTRSMLALWQAWGIDSLLREAWERGVLLAGTGAGGMCWFKSCITDSIAGSFTPLNGLGILPFSCCLYYDVPGRREAFQRLIAAGDLPDGFGIDECAFLHFKGDQVEGIGTAYPQTGAAAHRVFKKGEVRETRMHAFPLIQLRQREA
jgi:peptidase E